MLDPGWNKILRNHNFEAKKTGVYPNGTRTECYNNSGLKLNEYLKNCDKWEVAEIEKREDDLLEKASKIWDLKEYENRAKPQS